MQNFCKYLTRLEETTVITFGNKSLLGLTTFGGSLLLGSRYYEEHKSCQIMLVQILCFYMAQHELIKH